MAKAKKQSKKKPATNRPDKYEDKLKLNGTFEQLLNELANPKKPVKKK